ncbi:hypothetical protein XF30_25310 [Bradyrhizobium sp. SUTN9-2]|nr:hypothetical protein XF30_25310 [Bradyrhizobium sp. SUTN9-2]
MSENLDTAERCAQISKAANDETIRSIFARMSELYRELHEQEERLADWKRQQCPTSAFDFIFKKPRD